MYAFVHFIVGLLILPLACLVIASDIMAHPATSRLEAVQQAGELRVCIWPAYFAVSYRNPQSNHLEGIDIDLAREFAADLGVRPTFVDTSFVAFMDELENDRCDVAMFSVGVTEKRSRRVAFSAPYLCSDIYAVTTKTQRRVKTWEDIDQPGVVVAVQLGTYMEPLMRRLLKQAQILIVAPPRAREAEVQSGRADVFISDYPYTRRMLLFYDWTRVIEAPAPISPTNYAYAVKRGDPAWLARVDTFVAAIKKDGRLAGAAARHGLSAIVVP
jgi:ABC-type amino acid transport substrate-binding protein